MKLARRALADPDRKIELEAAMNDRSASLSPRPTMPVSRSTTSVSVRRVLIHSRMSSGPAVPSGSGEWTWLQARCA